MTAAYLGLGGNIGDPVANMRAALRVLETREDTRVVAVSRLFRTPPWGKTDQPLFFNAAARIETELGPRSLLDVCLQVEHHLERRRGERWGPRTVDLDLLDHGGRPYRDESLTLPHPRMAERAFVLVPLADIAPGFVIAGEPVERRLAQLDRTGIDPVSLDGTWWREKGPAG